MDERDPVIIRLLSPARPLLTRTSSPLHSIYHQNFGELPSFSHHHHEDQQLHHNKPTHRSDQQSESYTVYRRNILETWNFNLSKQQPVCLNYTPPPTKQHILHFESNFESGNLRQAEKFFGKDEYNLTMQRDINTYGFTQWFFFKVSNGIPNLRYRFNIVNFYKKGSLYEKGMKVLAYSVKENALNRRGWYRDGENINYFQNSMQETTDTGRIKTYFTLSFDFTFKHDDDTVFFAYNYPYTYTQLNSYLDRLEVDCKNILRRSLLTRTLAQNRVEMLTITNFTNNRPKKAIFVTGRTHPGQTVSSFIVKGIIDYLTSDEESAFQLRDNFIFKIVPMVNPDGVIHGNYRSNLSGSDLNRKWENPNKKMHSQIFALKRVILESAARTPLLMFCDMHGHSKKKNAFMYGCADKNNPFITKQFPFLVSRASEIFSFEDCSFGIKKDKKSTARAVLWKQLQSPNIYTLQTSFCGPTLPEVHFGFRHFQQIGRRFCQTLLIHFNDEVTKMEYSPLPSVQSLKTKKEAMIHQLYHDEKYQKTQQESDGSDSDVSIDEMSEKTILKIQKGLSPKNRAIVRKSPRLIERIKTPSTNNKRKNYFPQRLLRLNTVLRTQSPESKRFQGSQYREQDKLPFMFLQPKMFTIVDYSDSRHNNQWSYQSYQQYLNNTIRKPIKEPNTTANKSFSFTNRRAMKGNSLYHGNRGKVQLSHLIPTEDLNFKRLRTENLEQSKIVTIDYERKRAKNVPRDTKTNKF